MRSSLVASAAAPPARHGVLPGVVYLALDLAEKSQATALAVLQDARVELRTAVDHGIELVEKATAAALRFTRKAVQRIDEAGAETLSGAERVLGNAVKAARRPRRPPRSSRPPRRPASSPRRKAAQNPTARPSARSADSPVFRWTAEPTLSTTAMPEIATRSTKNASDDPSRLL
jgi:hypothetical protein